MQSESRWVFLIVEPDNAASTAFITALREVAREPFRAITAHSLDEVNQHHKHYSFDMCFFSLEVVAGSLATGIQHLRSSLPMTPVMVIQRTLDDWATYEALALGAVDFINFAEGLTATTWQRIVLADAKHRAEESASSRFGVLSTPLLNAPLDPRLALVGMSKSIADLQELIRVVAPTDAAVHVCGPSGLMRELVAKLIHQRSKRSHGAFVFPTLNRWRPSTRRNLLFGPLGKAQGQGAIHTADHGTLLIHELTLLDQGTQHQLSGLIKRVQQGDKPYGSADFRLITGSSKPLDKLVREGLVTPELASYLSVVQMTIDPIDKRRDDIVPLAEAIVNYRAGQMGWTTPIGLSDRLVARLCETEWPGDFEQLGSVMASALHGPAKSTLDLADIQDTVGTGDETASLLKGLEAVKDTEREVLLAAVRSCGGHISRAAEKLGMGSATLYRKLKQFGLSTRQMRREMKHQPERGSSRLRSRRADRSTKPRP